MAASVCAFILALYALCGSAAGSGGLSAPTNVRLTSYNMDLVLRWDPPEGTTDVLTYTAAYRSSATGYKNVCTNTSALECDFTSSLSTVYGSYTGRVRAHRGAENSSWVESNLMIMDKQTFIGPPSVTLHVTGTSLEVSIKDPVFKYSELREVYTLATYNITYWKSSPKEEVKTVSGMMQDRVVLSDLEPMSEYCVQVQIIANLETGPSNYSVVCEHTGDVDAAPWVAAVVAFVVMAAVVALVVTLVVYWTRISKFLCPEVVLPPHFKESLLPANPSIYLVSPISEHCDQVSIIADHRTEEEEEGGCSTQPDTSQEGG
ncbi:interleukin-10 receptor subunit beta isoform X1 [Oreochromis niloticus]|uniref:interleukin-10 receptor subunit beta isoform X1 n=2 Tax=Oreochromis niloticus TaxID=8128 RepID=UPI000905AF79|nr:interleukin-10 receptor subunit beta isoform X1 [Oreochromis niloticus]